ncbi:helix-turn-helix domain-containing GNAT family N-acetyltransferase [Nocardioides panacis]|uniref:Helix-turn-helix domain-containing GNAT family N-acetyltransferase n=2 Tax=Nocardioides panacis TaxID=2849501 RepID=A0A975Y2F6_9ACTN|nr:helix-turn-helix domain-containing GNAT family N-acetyltransferase [Nocardioides panacis]
MVETVRSFNRLVTQRVGALQDSYLARDRPLAQSRVLWEIGEPGCEVRTLRSRLDLDAGYLSRLLRSLEASGLVTVVAGPGDRRIRLVRLTAAGRRERALLDDRSDELARSMVAPLSAEQRDRLVTAMAQVRRLLTASMVEIEARDPAHAHARFCLGAYFSELDHRFDGGFDPDGSMPAVADDMRPPAGLFLVATLHGEPVGCGAVKFHADGPVELKRMWVSPAVRGLGVGRRLLEQLEGRAVEHGSRVIRLETNAALPEAVAMYRSSGYREVEAFNTEPYADHWFEKDLGQGTLG